jgi:hypothetical protein
MPTTSPFQKDNPPQYRLYCASVAGVEDAMAKIARRLPRCWEHNKPIKFRVICGDEDTATLLRLMCMGRGLAEPVRVPRDKIPPAWAKRDQLGQGPMLEFVAERSEQPALYRKMQPHRPKGTLVAEMAAAVEVKPVATEG